MSLTLIVGLRINVSEICFKPHHQDELLTYQYYMLIISPSSLQVSMYNYWFPEFASVGSKLQREGHNSLFCHAYTNLIISEPLIA